MKILRYAVLVVTALSLLLTTGAGTAQAIYTDTYTATILSIDDNTVGGWDPYGLAVGQEITWSMTWDPADVTSSGYIFPALNFNFPVIGTTGGYTFTLSDPSNYFDVWLTGNDAGATIDEYSIYGDTEVPNSPGPGYTTLELDNGDDFIYLDSNVQESGGFLGSVVELDLGVGSFDPATDRSEIPIPGALVLFGSGLISLITIKRRYRK